MLSTNQRRNLKITVKAMVRVQHCDANNGFWIQKSDPVIFLATRDPAGVATVWRPATLPTLAPITQHLPAAPAAEARRPPAAVQGALVGTNTLNRAANQYDILINVSICESSTFMQRRWARRSWPSRSIRRGRTRPPETAGSAGRGANHGRRRPGAVRGCARCGSAPPPRRGLPSQPSGGRGITPHPLFGPLPPLPPPPPPELAAWRPVVAFSLACPLHWERAQLAAPHSLERPTPEMGGTRKRADEARHRDPRTARGVTPPPGSARPAAAARRSGSAPCSPCRKVLTPPYQGSVGCAVGPGRRLAAAV